MNFKELKQAFKYEYQLTNNNYHALSLRQLREHDDNIIEINFYLNFQTFIFCSSTIEKGLQIFKINKIVTISFTGTVLEFKSIEEFISYIQKLENVRLINKL